MDQATLVKSDLEARGQVILALHEAKIPVTLVELDFVPQLQEWQLVVATSVYDTKGPHEANIRVLKALQEAGFYQDLPIRRLFVKSPNDPMVKDLEREVRQIKEGSIHIVGSSGRDEQYLIVFAPYVGPGGALPAKHISGRDHLRKFLELRLQIDSPTVESALSDLLRRRSTSIYNVQLTIRDAKRMGLA